MEDFFEDFLVVLADLQNLNTGKLSEAVNQLSAREMSLLRAQLKKLNRVVKSSEHIYLGKELADGIISGSVTHKGSVSRVLVNGPGCYYWCKPEQIKKAV